MESKCSAFWHHTNIRNDNKIYPCCRFKSPLNEKFDGDVSKILYSEEYEILRNKSESGKFIKGCEKCYYEEAMGKHSLRQKFNETYNDTEIKLEFLEIGFDNICNLTCDGCWDDFSSAWALKNNPTIPIKLQYKSIDEITNVPDSINKVLFLGGEPLMTNRHEKFLNMIKSPSSVEIIYNTNGTFLLNNSTLEKLKKFKTVKFILSLDGFKELNEKVRSGSKWEDILNFIQQVNLNEFELEINTVLHLNNWYGIKDLEKFIKTLNVPWTTNILTYPHHLNIKNYKNPKEIVELINKTNIPNKQYIINHLI